MLEERFDELHVAALLGQKRMNQKCVGAAVRRRIGTTWCIELFEFFDNDQWSNFDALLVQLGPCVVHLPDDLPKQDSRKVAGLVDRAGVSVHYVKRSTLFRKAEASAALLKLVGSRTHSLDAAESERELAVSAVDCLAQRLKLLQDADACGTYDVKLGSLETYMKLDSAAVEAINLLPKPDQPSQYGSIHGVLNRCRTKVRIYKYLVAKKRLLHVSPLSNLKYTGGRPSAGSLAAAAACRLGCN